MNTLIILDEVEIPESLYPALEMVRQFCSPPWRCACGGWYGVPHLEKHTKDCPFGQKYDIGGEG